MYIVWDANVFPTAILTKEEPKVITMGGRCQSRLYLALSCCILKPVIRQNILKKVCDLFVEKGV